MSTTSLAITVGLVVLGSCMLLALLVTRPLGFFLVAGLALAGWCGYLLAVAHYSGMPQEWQLWVGFVVGVLVASAMSIYVGPPCI
jgi:hypothetical protein